MKTGGSDGVASRFHNAYERKGRARLDVMEDHVRGVYCNDRQVRISSLQPFQLAHNVLHELGARVLLDETQDALHIDAAIHLDTRLTKRSHSGRSLAVGSAETAVPERPMTPTDRRWGCAVHRRGA